MSKPKILAFAGSTRNASYNKRLIALAAEAAQKAGASVTLIDLKDYPLPLMNEDLEASEGIPENAKKLKQLFMNHQGLMLACPEYNSSITPLLKNTIDWVSRREESEEGLACFDKKVAAIMSASPGALGGSRGLVTVRMLLGNIKVTVIPDQIAISKANEAFKEDGSLKDSRQQTSVEAIAAKLTEILKKLNE